MRWLAAVLVCGLVCSGKAQDNEETPPFLKIIANPTIVYNVNETKAIFCNSSIQPIEWYSPSNTKIERKTVHNFRIYVEKMSPRGGVPLIIHQVELNDAGNWTCKAGDLSATIDMIVGEKAKIADREVNVVGDEGRSVKMTCEVKGSPVPVVLWYKDSTPIKHDPKKFVIKSDNSLEIKKLDHMDVGTYVCKVRQKALSYYTDKTVHLSVHHKPILYNSYTQAVYTKKYKTEEVYAIINETKNITCSAIANPLPMYRWYRRYDSAKDEEIADSETVIHSADATNSVLVLRMYDETYLGEYKCTANNSKGEESIVFHVTLGSRPDPPDFVALAVANATELVFNVSCSTCPMKVQEDVSPDPANLTISGYAFELVPFVEGYEPDWDTAIQMNVDIINVNDTLFTVGSLTNKTKYHVRVKSINAAGHSEWFVLTELVETAASAFRFVACSMLIVIALTFTLYY